MTIRQIEQLETAFEAYGYFVIATPLPGMEETFAASLSDGFAKVQSVLATNAKRYGFRGKSKNALSALHKDLPNPVWGVELK